MRSRQCYQRFFEEWLPSLLTAHEQPFLEVSKTLVGLRRKYRRNRAVRSRVVLELLLGAIDSEQSSTVIDQLRRRTLRVGFTSFSSEILSVIAYAHFYKRMGNPEKGLRALYRVRRQIGQRKHLTFSVRQSLLARIEESIQKLRLSNPQSM